MRSPPRSQASGPAKTLTLRPYVSVANRGENVSWKLTDKPQIEIQIVKVTWDTLTMSETRGRSDRARQPSGLSAVPDANERGGDHTSPLSARATIPLHNPLSQKF